MKPVLPLAIALLLAATSAHAWDFRDALGMTLAELQSASGPLTETDGIWWRHYPDGLVALNPTDKRGSIRIEAPEGLPGLADAETDEVLTIRRGKVRITLKPGRLGVYVTPLALAESHLREALVAAETALATAAPDEPAPLLATLESIRAAHETMLAATDPSEAREPVADALRAVDACLTQTEGPWQTNPRVAGPLVRAQVYLSRAWTLTAEGKGLPAPSPMSDEIAGMPQLVRLCPACGVLHGLDLTLDGVTLLDAGGAATVPAEIESGEGWAMFITRPSLRDDLFHQVVARAAHAPEDLPIVIFTDYRPAPSVALEAADEATPWRGARGVSKLTITNRLDGPVVCALSVEAPEGYEVAAPESIALAPGEASEVIVEVTSAQPSAPPGEVTVKLTLPDVPGSGEQVRAVVFD